MHKINVLLLLWLTPTFLGAMGKYQILDIKPDSLAPCLTRAAQALNCDPQTIATFAHLEVCPNAIRHIRTHPGINKDIESYIADLNSGGKIYCVYIPSGEFAGEIWAKILLPSGNFLLPIPQKNFFILKTLHEKQVKTVLNYASEEKR